MSRVERKSSQIRELPRHRERRGGEGRGGPHRSVSSSVTASEGEKREETREARVSGATKPVRE